MHMKLQQTIINTGSLFPFNKGQRESVFLFRASVASVVSALLLILTTLSLTSCGPDGKHVSISGKLLNLNQGEFYVYSPDGATTAIDTIFIEGGRFDFEPECDHEGTLIIIMPGGQEVAVFVEPGESYDVSGNAQKLKEIEVKGGKANKEMNAFRKKIADITDPAIISREVEEYINSNPTTAIGQYLVRRYFILSPKPDYSKALALLATLQQEDRDNPMLQMLKTQVSELHDADAGCNLPSLNVTDINGRTYGNSDFVRGTWIICSFASFDFDSTNQLRRINSLRKEKNAQWRIVAISFDADKAQARSILNFDYQDYVILSDGKMTQTPIAQKLAIYQTGIVIIVRDGKIIERTLYGEPLYSKLREEY